MLKEFKKFMWGYPIIALILAAAGICLIALNNALMALAITIGAILTVTGIVLGILAIAKKDRGASFGFKVAFAAICIVCGIITMVFNKNAVEIIIAIFSLLLIVDASFKLHTSAMSKRYGVVLWWVILALSVLTIIGAFILIKFTPNNQENASILLGIAFLIDAISNLLSAFYVSACEKRQYYEAYHDAKESLEIKAAQEASIEESSEESADKKVEEF